MEANQVDVLASAVLGDLEQIDQAQESRLARQLRCNIWKPDRLDRIHLDLAFFQAVPAADSDMGTRPDTHTASDLPAANSVPKPLGERHAKECTPRWRRQRDDGGS